MKKTTITQIAKRKYRYEKWYVYHNRSKGTTQRWCYLSKKYLRLPEINEAILKEQATQNNPIATQNTSITTQRTNNLKLSSIQQKSLVTPFLPVSQANTRQQCMSTRTG
jgi:hypothetical protein